jgi:hypothetical protein
MRVLIVVLSATLPLAASALADSAQTYAVIDGAGNVVNTVVWDGGPGWQPPDGTTAVPANGAGIGWSWDGQAFHAPAQPTPPPSPAPTIIPALDFIDRFTPAEQLAIETAAQSSPALQLWLTKAIAAETVDLRGPEAAAGLDALVTGGLLDAKRKAEILTP